MCFGIRGTQSFMRKAQPTEHPFTLNSPHPQLERSSEPPNTVLTSYESRVLPEV